MSGYFCEQCWFKKITKGKEWHNNWATSMNENECIITREQCEHVYQSHEEIKTCPIMRAFYEGKPINSKQKTTNQEQLHLF